MPPIIGRASLGVVALTLLFSLSCSGGPGKEGLTPTQSHMVDHFERTEELHNALVRNDLEEAHRAAGWIAHHEEMAQIPEELIHHEDEVRAFAREVERADQLSAANASAARMGKACGDCHLETRLSPRFVMGSAPPGGSGQASEMARHVWASERMWEGLLRLDPEAWESGAQALRGGWLSTQEVVVQPRDKPHMRELVQRVYALADRAARATSQNERAEVYGEFLDTCTECHRLTAARIRTQEPV